MKIIPASKDAIDKILENENIDPDYPTHIISVRDHPGPSGIRDSYGEGCFTFPTLLYKPNENFTEDRHLKLQFNDYNGSKVRGPNSRHGQFIYQFVKNIFWNASPNKDDLRLYVHCVAGIGRTPPIVAAARCFYGLSKPENVFQEIDDEVKSTYYSWGIIPNSDLTAILDDYFQFDGALVAGLKKFNKNLFSE